MISFPGDALNGSNFRQESRCLNEKIKPNVEHLKAPISMIVEKPGLKMIGKQVNVRGKQEFSKYNVFMFHILSYYMNDLRY